MKRSVLNGVVLAGALVLSLGRVAATEPAAGGHEIQGQYYETCACAVSCPCPSNATLPTEGHCDAISLIHVDKGMQDGVNLDGLNIAVVFRSPNGKKVKDAFEKGEMDLFTFYLDDKANAEQKAAMPKVLGALFGGGEMKGMRPPQWVPMSLSVDGDTAKFQIAGGKTLSFEINNIDVGDKTKASYKKDDVGNRVVLSAAASPFPWVREVTQGISKSFKYSDLGTSWEYKERNAFFGAVTSKQ
jgi:hypothetical protein